VAKGFLVPKFLLEDRGLVTWLLLKVFLEGFKEYGERKGLKGIIISGGRFKLVSLE